MTYLYFGVHLQWENPKKISKRGERCFHWVDVLNENESKGTFFVSRLFLDSPIVLIMCLNRPFGVTFLMPKLASNSFHFFLLILS